MPEYIKFNKATGRIEGRMRCPADRLDRQLANYRGIGVIEVDAEAGISGATHAVADAGTDAPRIVEQVKSPPTVDIDALRASALRRLDDDMRVRRRSILGPSADVHAMKAAEARTVEAGGEPGPLLSVEAATRKTTAVSIARDVIARAAETSGRLVSLEVERQAKQAVIRAAGTPDEIESALGTAATRGRTYPLSAR